MELFHIFLWILFSGRNMEVLKNKKISHEAMKLINQYYTINNFFMNSKKIVIKKDETTILNLNCLDYDFIDDRLKKDKDGNNKFVINCFIMPLYKEEFELELHKIFVENIAGSFKFDSNNVEDELYNAVTLTITLTFSEYKLVDVQKECTIDEPLIRLLISQGVLLKNALEAINSFILEFDKEKFEVFKSMDECNLSLDQVLSTFKKRMKYQLDAKKMNSNVICFKTHVHNCECRSDNKRNFCNLCVTDLSFYQKDIKRVYYDEKDIKSFANPILLRDFAILNKLFSVNKNQIDMSNKHNYFKVHDVLKFENYPTAIWPEKYTVAIRQQFTINNFANSFNKSSEVIAVNGPPGTGKTTMLKEMFADIIYKKAIYMKENQNSLLNYDGAKWKVDPKVLFNYSIVVASNNNAAVENISKELPKSSGDIDSKFELKYLLGLNQNENKKNGLVSVPLGNLKNIENFQKYFNKDSIENYLVCDESSDIIYEKLKENEMLIKRQLENLDCRVTKFKKLYSRFSKVEVLIKECLDKESKLKNYLLKNDSNVSKLDIKLKSKKENLYRDYLKYKSSLWNIILDKIKFKKLYSEDEFYRLDSEYDDLYLRYIKFLQKKDKYSSELGKIEIKIEKLNLYVFQYQNFITNNFINEQKLIEYINNPFSSEEGNPLDVFADIKNLKELRHNAMSLGCRLMEAVLFELKDDIIRVLSESSKFVKYNLYALMVPVISTSLAGVERFYFASNRVTGNVFIDEAGQATPNSVIGIAARANNLVVVGDPFQVEPVVKSENLIDAYLGVNEDISVLGGLSSIQTLADRATMFIEPINGINVGAPLVVHRRCINPMFEISNDISYDNKMVLASNLKNEKPKIFNTSFISVESSTKSVNRATVCDNQLRMVREILELQPDIKNEIFIISPFRCVVQSIKNKNLVPKKNVGTVHTFQGKETDIVIFVAGLGAESFITNKPNMMNVALTRAKKSFIFIGPDSWSCNNLIGKHLVKHKREIEELKV